MMVIYLPFEPIVNIGEINIPSIPSKAIHSYIYFLNHSMELYEIGTIKIVRFYINAKPATGVSELHCNL